MAIKKELMTRETFESLERELKELVSVRRKEVAAALESAKSQGDLSENAEYHEAREEQAMVEHRIGVIEEMLKNAEIVSRHSGDVVEVGATVTVKKPDGAKVTYTLVGAEEADVTAGKISYQSPLGQALMGKKKGECANVNTPRGEVCYDVIEIK
jgi:transcription elongation factor GreA